MTNEQQRIIETAVDEAIAEARAAVPGGGDEQLTAWVEEHLPPFSPGIEAALAAEARRAWICGRAFKLGITLQE